MFRFSEEKLESLEKVDVEFHEVTALLKEGNPAQAIEKYHEIRDKLETKRLTEGKGLGSDQKVLDSAADSLNALAAQLERHGKVVHAPLPTLAATKLERQRANENQAPLEFSEDAEVMRSVAATVQRADWPPRYDPVVRHYFGRPAP